MNRDHKELKKETLDAKIDVMQLQDRAKLLWTFNVELQSKIKKNSENHNKIKVKNDDEMKFLIGQINKYSDKIEELTKEGKFKRHQLLTINHDFLEIIKAIETKHLVQVDEKRSEIAA